MLNPKPRQPNPRYKGQKAGNIRSGLSAVFPKSLPIGGLPPITRRPTGLHQVESLRLIESFDTLYNKCSHTSNSAVPIDPIKTEIRLCIKNNQSGTKRLRIASIEAMQGINSTAQIIKAYTINHKRVAGFFSTLFDNKPFKDNEWEDFFPDDGPYTIIFTVISTKPITALRIYPSRQFENSLKDIEIYVENYLGYQGEVDKFITVTPLAINKEISNSLLVTQPEETVQVEDNYGCLPVIHVNTVTFHFLSSWALSSNKVAVEEIQMYGINGEKIPVLDRGTVRVEGAKTHENAARLFYDRSHPRHPCHEKWEIELTPETTVSVCFREAEPVALIVIRNAVDRNWSSDDGLKKLSIAFDSHVCWSGTVQKRIDVGSELLIWQIGDGSTRQKIIDHKYELDKKDYFSEIIDDRHRYNDPYMGHAASCPVGYDPYFDDTPISDGD